MDAEARALAIKAAKIHPDAILPTRKHADDAGIDFYALNSTVISPHSFEIIKTGITVEIPVGYVGLMKPKSRNDHILGAGVIDAGYQGEIRIKLANLTDVPLSIGQGMPIAQMLILPVETPAIDEVPIDEIHRVRSERGATGGILGTE